MIVQISNTSLNKRLEHRKVFANLFAQGLKRHGVEYNFVKNNTRTNTDLHVAWGLRQINPSAQHFILLENAYLYPRCDSKGFPLNVSVAFDGLNGRGNFLNKGKDSTRYTNVFEKTNPLKEWRTEPGRYILLTQQVIGDQSLKHYKPNYFKIVQEIQKHTNIPIVVRPHPVRPAQGNLPTGVKVDGRTPLITQFKHAHAVVCVNSNASVEALLHGVPVLNLDPDGSMTGQIGMTSLTELNNPPKPDRQQWLNEISSCQWYPKEISDGDCWEHLKQFYE